MLQLLQNFRKNDFSKFLKKSFYSLNPSAKFLNNWHIDLICDYLKACESGGIKRLIINIPPRYMKSIIVNVAWPAWLLANNPTKRIISASYSSNIAEKHSLDCRNIISQDWFRKKFPDTILSKEQNQKEKFMTTERGFRMATSIGGSITGEGGNFLIIDDPNNPALIGSKTYRLKVLNWYEQVFSSRLDNRNEGVIIIIMQRLHKEDLTGLLLEKNPNSWEVLKIPAIIDESARKYFSNAIIKPRIFDDKNIFRKIFNLKLNRKISKGESFALHAKHQSINDLEATKKEMGGFAFSAQYLQNPINSEDSMVRQNWLRYYNTNEENKIFTKITQSWDTAIKTGKNNDFSACTTWGEFENNFYLLDIFRDKLDFPDLKKAVINLANKWRAEKILIEDKSSGQSLIQEVLRETKLPIIPIKVRQDKISRFAKITPLFEAGKIFLPKNHSKIQDYEIEITTFPNSSNDDLIDSTSQYLNHQRDYKEFNLRRI
ncbi:MAG: phage terminase large subunit [Rickettsiales bacterium]|nr:phage terminase large subunit [Rickettsiales bacterium]